MSKENERRKEKRQEKKPFRLLMLKLSLKGTEIQIQEPFGQTYTLVIFSNK